ncbi:MAG: 50S ribosomal protein L17 [Bacteroidota bacterium]|nr:50S ribosomal protein L17 [Bacteroidota bacterium]
MRHGKRGFKLGRTSAHRKATLAALSAALIEHKQIRTTLTKAKAARQFIEPLITRALDDTTHNRRMVFRYLRDKYAVTELFDEVADRVGSRRGGYTRIVRMGPRKGDGAEMAIIELVDYNESEPEDITKRHRRTRRGRHRSKATHVAPIVTEVEAALGDEVADRKRRNGPPRSDSPG